MAHKAGKTGNVYVADQLLEDCEDAWNESVDGDATATADSGSKVGDYCCKLAVDAALADGDIIATEVIASTDITAYTHLMYWAKHSVGCAAGDTQIGVSETASLGGSPVYSDIPVLAAGTWTYCRSSITTTGLNAVISIGAKQTANDPGAYDLYLDDIRAAKVAAGIKSWTLDYAADTLETTDFADSGVATYVIGVSRWSGTFEGYKDGVPLSIGSLVGLELAETSTAGELWKGNAYITRVQPTTAHDGVVAYSYDFQGTGDLTVPTA